MKDLKNKLAEYSESGIYPFHMPGHKRNTEKMPQWNPWQIDVTELEGTDNLHHAEGMLKDAMERAAKLAGAEHSYFLVNGSTGGILSAIASVVKSGDTVLVARNCHKSVYHAIALNHLKAFYIYPEWIEEYHMAGGICPEKLEKALEKNEEIKAVILTSPTYEGMVSDIRRIAELVHKRGLPLIVDEAHGAHFNQEGFPVSAVKLGADIVIQSYHKTLPALTQTGVLHLCGKLVDRERLERFLAVYQTSSPSYVLMASIDYAVAFLEQHKQEMKEYGEYLKELRRELSGLRYISLPGQELMGKYAVHDVDNSKLILSVCGKYIADGSARTVLATETGSRMNGKTLYDRLRLEYGLQCEMALEGYALAMTSVMDTKEGYERLKKALYEIDENWGGETEPVSAEVLETELTSVEEVDKASGQKCGEAAMAIGAPPAQNALLTITQAEYAEKSAVEFRQAAGEISGEYLYLYPPGVPLLVPGEQITEEIIRKAEYWKSLGFELQGLRRENEIQVCENRSGATAE